MEVEISYQTQQLPAPFAYGAYYKFSMSDGILATSFELEYLDRDELTEEDITGEGFTLDDDLKWSGTLHANWITIVTQFRAIKYGDHPDSNDYVHVVINGQPKGFPVETGQALGLLQELMQAIFETAQKEAPLEIQYFKDSELHRFGWHFTDRTFLVNRDQKISWEDSFEIMQDIYALEADQLELKENPYESSLNLGYGWFSLADKRLIKSLNKLVLS